MQRWRLCDSRGVRCRPRGPKKSTQQQYSPCASPFCKHIQTAQWSAFSHAQQRTPTYARADTHAQRRKGSIAHCILMPAARVAKQNTRILKKGAHVPKKACARKTVEGANQRGRGVFSGCRELRCVHSGTAPPAAGPAAASAKDVVPWHHACMFSDMIYACATCSRLGPAHQMSAVHLGAGALLVCAACCASAPEGGRAADPCPRHPNEA